MLCVDDLIFIGKNPKMFGDFERLMINEFEMINIGLMSHHICFSFDFGLLIVLHQ